VSKPSEDGRDLRRYWQHSTLHTPKKMVMVSIEIEGTWEFCNFLHTKQRCRPFHRWEKRPLQSSLRN